jgi:hypothetical protein
MILTFKNSINGKLLKTSEESERLNHILITRDSEYLITGGEKGMIVLRSFYRYFIPSFPFIMARSPTLSKKKGGGGVEEKRKKKENQQPF